MAEEELRTTALHEAVAAGAQRDVERLLLSRKCFLDERNEQRQTALHLAVLHGRLDLLDWLLTAGKTLKSHSLDVNAVDAAGSSALHLACASAALGAVRVLLAHECSPFLPSRAGDTPLLLLLRASERLEAAALEPLLADVQAMLAKGVNVAAANANGDTALHLLLRHCHPALLPPLLALVLGACPAALLAENKAGQSPLAFAVQRGLLAALKVALSHEPPAPAVAALLPSCTDDRVRALLEAYVADRAPAGEEKAKAAPAAAPAAAAAPSTAAMAAAETAQEPIVRSRPGLVTRCRLLRQPYPREQFEVKVLVPQILSEAIQVSLTPSMRVGEAIQKLRGLRGLQRHEHVNFGLYLPRQTPDNSSPSPSRALSPGRGSSSTQLYLDPELFLWHYGLGRGDLLSLKKCDAAAEARTVWLKAITKAGGELQTRTIRVEADATVDRLADVVGRQFLTISNQFTGLFLHNDHRSGVWMEPGAPLSRYGVASMDIVELREKPVYRLGFVGGGDDGEIVCDDATLVGELTKMVTCWISAPVDDPRQVGLLHVRQTADGPEQLWLDQEAAFGSYGLGVGAQVSCFSRKGDPNSQQVARLEVRRDPAACLADAQPKLSAVVQDLPLLAGEEFVDEVCGVNCLSVGAAVSDGYLFVTNAHLIFGKRMRFFVDYSAQIPLASICRVEKVTSSERVYLDVACKDMRSVRFDFTGPEAKENRKAIYWHVLSLAFPKHLHELFAFHHRPKGAPRGAGWDRYSLAAEFQRMNVSAQLWRISSVNADYACSPTYPAALGVPASFSDEQLQRAFPFRSKGRIPMLAYYHHNTATITRCSQPKVGMTSNRSAADEQLVEAIRAANKAGGQVLHLFDARPRANALANTALGMGYEKVGGDAYGNCRLEFLNIDNIHVMRDCYNRLQRLCETSGRDDKGFYAALDGTRWLAFVKLLLESAVKIARLVDEGSSVMLHCSDGWDRTAQLSALAQIFLSPYYRTLDGFVVLVEKEWISAGHKFHGRHGHGDNNPGDEQRSPIFLQFLDCVYQCLVQYPCEFEFTEALLVAILDGLYSCHYGTFLCNNERERLQANLRQTTPSLWAAVDAEREKYLNPLYLRGVGVVYPSAAYERLRLWGDYYMRWCRRPSEYAGGVTVELRALQLSEQAKQLQGQVSALQARVAELEGQLKLAKAQ